MADRPGLSRRAVLGMALAGLTVVSVGGVALGWPRTALRTPKGPLQVLTPAEYSVAAAVASRICPGGDGLPTADEVDVAGKLDALLRSVHPAKADEIRLVLKLLDNALAELLLAGTYATFSASAPEVQDALLTSWATSGIAIKRQAFKGLHGLCSGCYWSDTRVQAWTGFKGLPNYGLAPAKSLRDPDSYFAPPPPPPEAVPQDQPQEIDGVNP